MFLTYTLVALQIAAGTPQADAPPSGAEDPVPAMGAALDRLVPAAMDRHRAPGVTLALVGSGTAPLLRAWGELESGGGRAVNAESTPFRVASVSKLFIAAAAALLEDRGRLDPELPIDTYLPEFGDRFPLGIPTLAQLLTHTSGLEDVHIGMFARSAEEVRPLEDYLLDRLPEQAAAPGDRTAYSNHGAALAALLIERVAGLPFDRFVAEEIFVPLGMTSSTFAQPLPEPLLARLALGHRCGSDGCVAFPLDYRQSYPAGGLVATAPDMARFLAMQLGHADARVLSPEALAELHRLRFSHDPAVDQGMALGFLRHRRQGVTVLTHAGSSSGYHSLVALLPGLGIGLFVAVNGGDPALLREILDVVLAEVGPGLAEDRRSESPPPIPLDAAAAAAFTGVYLETRGVRSGVERFPALFQFPEDLGVDGAGWLVRDEGGETRRYGQVGPALFRQIDGDDYLAFRVDARGEVTHLFAGASFGGSEFPAAYRRLAAYDQPRFVNEALSWTLMIPLLVLALIWPLSALIGAWLRGRRATGKTEGRRWGGIEVAAITSALAFASASTLFAFGFAARLNALLTDRPEELAYGMPSALARLAWLGSASLVLGVALLAFTLLVWRRGRWSLASRLHFTVVALSGAALLALLVRHGLVPAVW